MIKINYVSYTEEIKDNCWNTSIIHGNINYENIIFEKLFSSKDCIITKGSNQNGGRIVNFDENHILLSVGDYRSRALPQDKKSINGKIIKINIIILIINRFNGPQKSTRIIF